MIVVLTAIGVGASTIIGGIISFLFGEIKHKTSDIILSFASGVMLGASFFSLIIPALSYDNSLIMVITGIIFGCLFINVLERFTPHLHQFINSTGDYDNLKKTYYFLMAIAIHNFPEGLAVGVTFGTQNISDALAIALGISLQNIPEGMITILPLLAGGLSRKKALAIAFFTGSTEILGVLIGYMAISISTVILPFMLAFAGGTMLYIISNDIIPETHSHGYEKQSTYALIFGLILMLLIA